MKTQTSSCTKSRWSWSIARIAGIDLRVHGTFLILLGWLVVSRLAEGVGLAAASEGLLVIASVFAVVVLHELGHALVARRYGIRTLDITLLPIGGVARLERLPTEPRQELFVALAGPAVNVALATLTVAAVATFGAMRSPRLVALAGSPLLTGLLWLNVGMAGFNLLPAFPMDGGRVLRAFLAMHTSRARATDLAARIGHWMALGFALLGLLGNPMLVFIALFVWTEASKEAALVRMSGALDRGRVGGALERLARAEGGAIPVVDSGRFVGFLVPESARRVAEARKRRLSVH